MIKPGIYISRYSNINKEGYLKARRVGTNQRLISLGFVCFLINGGFFTFILFEPVVVNAENTIYVDDDNIFGPWLGTITNPYQTVQDGIDNSTDGDTVFVFNGTYYEHVIVNKIISLIGEDVNSTTIDGGGIDYEDVVRITADRVSISGFTLTNTGAPEYDSGIEVKSNNNTIFGNKISQCGTGIFPNSSNSNIIFGNTLFSNDFCGILLNHSNTNNIFGNTMFLNGQDGIWLRYSNDNNIIGNNGSNNGDWGINLDYSSNNIIKENTYNSNGIAGIRFDYSDYNIIENNTCYSNRNGIEFFGPNYGNNIHGNIISYNNRNGIWFINYIDRNIISGNTIFSNGNNGIDFGGYCDGNNITGNNIFSNNANGIYLYLSNHTEIKNNNISMNNETGIRLSDSHDNTIKDNIVSNNNDGIDVELFCDRNDIERNNISSNSENGIWISWYSNNNNFQINNISDSLIGINMSTYSYNNILTSNNISNNLIGMNISSYSEDNDMSANHISNNLYGVIINSSDSNTFTRNNFISNTFYAINISSGMFNLIYHNNFIDNNGGGIQANDSAGMNGWYINYPTGGNYWNDWTAPDTKSGPNQDQPGSDGFVDFPYYLDGGASARDRYPFADPMDFAPPEITNLKPPDGSTINDTTPTISANYSDPSGIDTGSVILTVNGMDFTSSATITPTGVRYIPATALSDGIYTIYIEVQDVFGYMASEIWSFIIDATPPDITNLQPPDVSTINDTTPTISADYGDPSGINISCVMLMVDGIDVTSFAIVTSSGVSYIPGIALSEGIHTVYLEVWDNVGNLATATWSFTIEIVLPPPTNLTTKIVNNGNNVELKWEPPVSLILDHYLIYRADSATDFDFSIPYTRSITWSDPLNTTWIDPDPSIAQIDDDFYYIIRAANFDESDISSTSNTAGIWTRTFEPGISTFSLPLEPFMKKDTEFYCQDMNASYIKWMNHTTHTWEKYYVGNSENNTFLELGEGYEVKFGSQTKYTFCGMTGAMIVYDDDSGLLGFDPYSEAKNLSLSVESNGDVTLNWQEPSSMTPGDWYEIYYSNTRDGFFGSFGVHYDLACPTIDFGTNTTTITGLGASDPGARLYFMVVPFNASGVRGSSSYSIGVWTEEYLSEYDTLGIPLKLKSYRTADWYCNNIPDCVGINYYIFNDQRWGWHATRMPAGAFDVVLEMGEGYQISTSGATKFTFVGV